MPIQWILVFQLAPIAYSQQSDLPEQARQWSHPFWIDQLQRTSRALSSKGLDLSQTEKLGAVPTSERSKVFDRFLSDLLESEAFAQFQADAWMIDHFQLGSKGPEGFPSLRLSGWDTELYRSWLVQSFRENLGFDQFVHRQLMGVEEPSSKVPTHAWYLANQRSGFQILRNPTPIESNLVRQFQSALDAIQRTEDKDWNRLVDRSSKDSNEIKSWWGQQRAWPTPPAEELVWSWPSVSDSPSGSSEIKEGEESSVDLNTSVSPVDIDEGKEYRVAHAPELKVFREWSLILVAKFSHELLAGSDPIPVFIQSLEGQSLGTSKRCIVLQLNRGRLELRLIHDGRLSERVIRMRERIAADESLVIALVNDGLGNPDSVQMIVDGTPQTSEIEKGSDGCLKEVVVGQPNTWTFLGSPLGGWRIEQSACYRVGLSVPECRGLAESIWFSNWEEMDQVQKLEWVQHYAMRVDPQWRYQRESRMHYLSNMRSIFESESMLPILPSNEQLIFLTQPDTFPFSLVRWDPLRNNAVESLPGIVSQTTAKEWSLAGERIGLENLARCEIRRSWQMMQRNLGQSDQEIEIPVKLLSEFQSDWDRRRMMRGLVRWLLERS